MVNTESNNEQRVNRGRRKGSFDTRRDDDTAVDDEEEISGLPKIAESQDQRSFERILQRSGRGSVAVILPHPWLDKGHLKVHDRIFLRWQQDGSLRIGSLRQPEEDAVFMIDASQGKLPHGFGRSRISAYIEGYNAMRISMSGGLTKEQHDDILAHASKLIGLAVVGENGDNIMIRCYLDPFKNDIS